MQEMTWLKTHLESIDEAVKLINRFQWFLEIKQVKGMWYVTTGELEKHVIFCADSRDAADAFVYGMGLAYEGIPAPYHEQLIENVTRWYESQ